jgi:hypothetical protein
MADVAQGNQAGHVAVDNNELQQRSGFDRNYNYIEEDIKRIDRIKSRVCNGSMSSEACTQAVLTDIKKGNDQALKYLIDVLTFIPAVGYVDSGSILINGQSLSGDEVNRLWGALGFVSFGYGQKLNTAGKTLGKIWRAIKPGDELVTSTGHVIKNVEANAIKNESRGVGKEAGKEAANAEKGTTTVKSTDGISFNIEQPKHLATVDGFSQKNGISGGHNADAFYSAVKQNGVKIVSETPTGTNGITNVRYQVPALDRAGNVIGYKAEVKTKTIYDPKIFTDQKMLDLGQQAAMKGYKEAMSSSKGIADATVNGITFRIYVDKTTGTVRNFHPK